MSSHERQGEFDFQPDQPYGQLDIVHKALIETLAAQARARLHQMPEGAEARLEFLKTISEANGSLDDTDFVLLRMLGDLDNLPGPDFPPGLPPRLQALLQADRSDRLPPDTPQN